ncbi:MAG: hypothetical protein IPK20_12435 [Betaproteobacteria bacterium]|nr:hypothetical protein [Betaproteobacteria bacterium]
MFDIANDPEESHNVASSHPDRVKGLLAALNEYAYDMVPSLHLEESIAAGRPVFWRANPPRR